MVALGISKTQRGVGVGVEKATHLPSSKISGLSTKAGIPANRSIYFPCSYGGHVGISRQNLYRHALRYSNSSGEFQPVHVLEPHLDNLSLFFGKHENMITIMVTLMSIENYPYGVLCLIPNMVKLVRP